MVKLRAEKIARIARDFPPLSIYGDQSGDLLLIGWGSTKGTIEATIDRARAKGHKVGAVHLRHINPLPTDLEEIFSAFKHIMVPEINNGQLIHILRNNFMLPFIPFNKIQGLPIKAGEIIEKIDELLG